MENVFLLGRIIFSMMFLGSGIGHFLDQEGTTAYAKSKGLSNPELMGQVLGALLFAGGVGIALGVFTDLAFLLTGVLVLIIGFVAHPFWKYEGEMQQAEMPNFMKNLTIFGACVMGFAFFAQGYDANQIIGPIFEFDWN